MADIKLNDMKFTDDIIKLLENPLTTTMIGTADTNNNIDLEYVTSAMVTSNDEIIFPFFNNGCKTVQNIKKNKYVSLAMVHPPVIGYKCNGILRRIDKKVENLNHFIIGTDKPSGIIVIRVTDIFALTMAISGHKIA